MEERALDTTRGDESVYLEERNRLLRQKVRSQTATIERQANRIDELESELDVISEQLAAVKQREVGASEDTGPIGWMTKWLTEP